MKKGFTLAEVLVTLGIIGFVATLTIPTLKIQIWKSQRGPLLRTAVNHLQTAIDKTQDELGYTPRCAYWGYQGNPYTKDYNIITHTDETTGSRYWTWEDKKTGQPATLPGDWNGNFDDCADFGRELTKNLLIVKKCKGTGECKPEYEGNDKVFKDANIENYTDENKNIDIAALNKATNTSTSGMGGFRTENMKANYAFYLPNGSSIINYMGAQYDFIHPRIFAIDTNGKKGPNKWGQDLFYTSLQYGRDGRSLELQPTKDGYKQSYGGIKGESFAAMLRNRECENLMNEECRDD